jgi:tripartite-type tricarboxylate transporter receptor subunit TctC
MALCLQAGAAQAQPYPSKPLTIVVPTSAGGTTDLLARLVASHIAARSGKQVVIDNRSGAGGNIGVDAVVRAAPDGHTR